MFPRVLLLGLLAIVAGCAGEQGVEDSSQLTQKPAATSLPSPALGIFTTRPARGVAFASLPDRGNLVAYPERLVRRDGAYTWHRASLSEQHALQAIASGRLTVTTPSGQNLNFSYQRHVEHPSGDWTWIGKLDGAAEGEQTILTFGQKAAFGTIAQPGLEPLRLTIREGVSWLVETDRKALAAIHNADTRPKDPDFFIPPKLAAGRIATSASSPSLGSAGAPSTVAATAAAAANTLDLVLGYTTGFAASLGGQSQAMTRLNFLVEVTNQSYVNSQVDAKVRLVHALQVDYPDATSNDTALQELTGFRAPSTPTTPAAAFSALRAARDQYGGDLVSLVRKFNTPENEGCGIAWLIGGGRTGIDQSDEYFGYSVVSDGTDMGSDGKSYFCREETLAHELGHNMGSQHDRAAATDNGTLKYGVYNYSFGFKAAADTGNFYTVMAYGESGQTRYRVFSNPRITYCGGYACGVAEEADNARSLAQTIPIVSTFRGTVVVSPPTVKVTNDVDGDGKSDLLWHNAQQGRFSYWTMDGVRVASQVAVPIALGYRVATSGDFNGDRLLDILWTSSANDLHLWTGNGTSFSSTRLFDYCCGWAVVGKGDINGDGKSDVLWHNSAQAYFSYWIMDGARVAAQVGFPIAAGSRMVSASDFNGDSLVDILWTNAANELHLWLGNGYSFTPARLPNYCCDWVVVGAGDINGDGRADLLWHNAQQGRFSYWIMDGARVVSQIGMPVAAGYRLASTGDFNGDGMLDLVWTSNSNDLWMWVGNGSTFTSTRLYDYCCDWKLVTPSFY